MLHEKSFTLNKTMLKKSSSYGWAETFKVIAIILISLYLSAFFFSVGIWLWGLVAFIFVGVGSYKATIILHDCVHFTLFSRPSTNVFVGRTAAGLLGSDFYAFRSEHLGHHRNCGTPKDNSEGNFKKIQHAGVGTFLFFVFKPLFGITYLLDIVGGYFNPSEVGGDRDRPKIKLVFILFSHLIIAFTATLGLSYWPGIFIFPAAAATFGLFLSRLRGICEHLSTTAWRSSECFIRTHKRNFFDSIFFYCCGMNFHREHHLYPGVPSCNLPALHKQLVITYKEDEISSSIILTFFSLLKARMRSNVTS